MLHPSTIQLLRFHFSLFLLPVYLFAVSQLPQVNIVMALAVFFILHVLVYPSSNGYNSYMDRDETPIGGLLHPLQPTRQLFYVTVVMDVVALLLSLVISPVFAVGILLYILASRAYSYRKIRLKRFPFAGFLTVFIFQGALVFFLTWHGAHPSKSLDVPVMPAIISSCLLGALYPLTQVYQHEEDRKDGVITISYLVGKKGTFILSAAFFSAATVLLYFLFRDRLFKFWLFLLVMLPVVSFFLYWMMQVWRHPAAASFKNSLRMNMLATLCTSLFFLLLMFLH